MRSVRDSVALGERLSEEEMEEVSEREESMGAEVSIGRSQWGKLNRKILGYVSAREGEGEEGRICARMQRREGMHTGVHEVVVFVFGDGTGLRLLEFFVFDFFELDHCGFWVWGGRIWSGCGVARRKVDAIWRTFSEGFAERAGT